MAVASQVPYFHDWQGEAVDEAAEGLAVCWWDYILMHISGPAVGQTDRPDMVQGQGEAVQGQGEAL